LRPPGRPVASGGPRGAARPARAGPRGAPARAGGGRPGGAPRRAGARPGGAPFLLHYLPTSYNIYHHKNGYGSTWTGLPPRGFLTPPPLCAERGWRSHPEGSDHNIPPLPREKILPPLLRHLERGENFFPPQPPPLWEKPPGGSILKFPTNWGGIWLFPGKAPKPPRSHGGFFPPRNFSKPFLKPL